MKNWLSIGEFGKTTGLSTKALRLYEEKGILVPHTRSESHYRVYTPEQIVIAQRIVQFKKWGFSLEQIKILMRETDGHSLQQLLEKRLQESRVASQVLSDQIESLEAILTSMKHGQELSVIERGQVMDNLLDVSLNKLKRKGVLDQASIERVRQEVSLYSPGKRKFIEGLRKILDYAKNEDILLGPGRGSTAGSLVLFAEGYSNMNPLHYGLLPELFGESKYIWLDVEYSRHQEIGTLCNELARKTSIEIVAFRSPILDIFKKIERQIGKVEFDSFSDLDPMILQAPKKGTRGLFWLEWNPRFHAFQDMKPEKQQELTWDNVVLEKFYTEHDLQSPIDYMALDSLMGIDDRETFFAYPSRSPHSCPSYLPELKATKGVLIFREDWLQLAAKHAGISLVEANSLQRAVAKNPQGPESLVLEKIEDQDIKDLLINRASKVSSKSHALTSWWHYKRTAILKSLWPSEYLAALDEWEKKNDMVWFEFGYKTKDGNFYLQAGP